LEADAQELLPPVRVNGSVTPEDAGGLELPGDDYEDLYLLRLANPIAVTVELVPSAADLDLDLLVARTDDYTILGSGLTRKAGAAERIESLDLPAGSYYILVSQYGETPAAGGMYSLFVVPTSGADSDGDGLSDLWEMAHFGSLNRNGSLDWDKDGLGDIEEYRRGTHPQVADTDGDGMPDGWEAAHRLDPLVNDAAADPDRDGKTNLQEYKEGTDPNPPRATPWLPLLLE
jgi:hypothetical protein